MSIITMVRLGLDGQPMAEGNTEKHVALLLPQIGWMLTPTAINKKAATQTKLLEMGKKVDLLGHKDWELAPIELLKLAIDHTRYRPALNPEFFYDIPTDWLWSSTTTPWSESSAFFVDLYGGNVDFNRRGGSGFGLACRRARQ